MYTIYLLLAILAVSSILGYGAKGRSSWMNTIVAARVHAVVSGLFLLLTLISIPVSRLVVAGQLQGIEAIRAMNTGGEGLEMTHWRTTVSKANTRLAEMKYYASNPWTSAWYPKAVLTVEPIR